MPVFLLGDMGNRKGRDDVPAEDFFQDGFAVRQVGPVGEVGQAVVADNSVDLGLGLLLHFREQSHGEEHPVDGGDGLKNDI